MNEIKIGDYVLATKYEDGDSQEQWCVGFYKELMTDYQPNRHDVVNGDGKSFRGNGFRKVTKISVEVGRYLLDNAPLISEGSKSLNWWLARAKEFAG